jgi:phosphate uptake regulator
MPKVTVSKIHNGERTIVSEGEISKEKATKIIEAFAKSKAEIKERMQKRFDEIPKINWEILRYGNNHTKEEVLSKYPEHQYFINSIRFNNP